MEEIEKKSSEELARMIAEFIADRMGDDVHLLDMRELTDIADWFIIASSKSKRHLRALSQDLIHEIKQAEIHPAYVEGVASESWIIVDIFDVVIHLFLPERREYFSLEDYWADAPREVINSETVMSNNDDRD